MASGLRICVSIAFALGVGLAILASMRQAGLVWYVEDDGSLYRYRESSGSIAGQDEYLFFAIVWLPSAILRLVRAARRPWLFEIGLFAFVSIFVVIGWRSVGTEALARTLDLTGDGWLLAWCAAVIISPVLFGWATLEGWVIRRRV